MSELIRAVAERDAALQRVATAKSERGRIPMGMAGDEPVLDLEAAHQHQEIILAERSMRLPERRIREIPFRRLLSRLLFHGGRSPLIPNQAPI